MTRLAIIASHVIQYQDPFFRLLAHQSDIDPTVIYCSLAGAEQYRDEAMKTTLRWDIELLQGYRYLPLRNFGWGQDQLRLLNPGLFTALRRGAYDAALFMTGWSAISAWIGFAACRVLKIPILMYGDSSFVPDEKSIPRQLRFGFLRTLFRLTSAFMISGRWNAEYYQHYGADSRRFFPMPWAIDNERFAAASRLSPDERREIRVELGIPHDALVVAYSGKLIERKDPLTLVRAYERLRNRDNVALLFVGDGELRNEIEAYAASHDLRGIVITGFVNQARIPKLYGMSDVFCLPSSFDPRATVVNEAMACGLPVLITDRCGPAGDIAQHGDNAFVFPFGDDHGLANYLDRLATEPALIRRMSQRSREIISTWNYEAGITGLRAALRFVQGETAI